MKHNTVKPLFTCCLFFGLLSISSTVFAKSEGDGGAIAGGGGNARVCFDNWSIPSRIREEKSKGNGWIGDSDISHITSVEILDLYEAHQPIGEIGSEPLVKKLIEAHDSETIKEYTERLLSRFSVLVPALQVRLDWAKLNMKTQKLFPNGLAPIDDVGPGETVNSANCVRMTIIGQYTNGSEEFIGYDPRIFNLPNNIHSTTSKALALIHEYIYFNARHVVAATTSDSARALVGAMINEDQMLLDFLQKYNAVTTGFVLQPNSSLIEDRGTSYLSKLVTEIGIDLGHQPFRSYTLNRRRFQSKEDMIKECKQNFMTNNIPKLKEYYEKNLKEKLFSIKEIPDEVKINVEALILGFLLSPKIECSADSCEMYVTTEKYVRDFYNYDGVQWTTATGWFQFKKYDSSGNRMPNYYNFKLPSE
jgi:hypothetical protein